MEISLNQIRERMERRFNGRRPINHNQFQQLQQLQQRLQNVNDRLFEMTPMEQIENIELIQRTLGINTVSRKNESLSYILLKLNLILEKSPNAIRNFLRRRHIDLATINLDKNPLMQAIRKNAPIEKIHSLIKNFSSIPHKKHISYSDIEAIKDEIELNKRLLAVIDRDNLQELKDFLNNNNVNLNFFKNSNNPLIYAIKNKKSYRLINFLIQCKMNINFFRYDGGSPLSEAAITNNRSVFNLLLKNGANVNLMNYNRENPLFYIMKRKNVKIPAFYFSKLLEENSNVNIKDRNNKTMLIYLSSNNKEKIVDLLLSNTIYSNSFIIELIILSKNKVGVSEDDLDDLIYDAFAKINVDETDADSITALMHACQNGSDHIVKTLINYNADINKETKENKRPLFFACEYNRYSVAKILLETEGIEVNRRSKYGDTELSLACNNNNPDLVRLLIEHHSDIDVVNEKGYHLVHIATINNNIETLKVLIENGADVNAGNSSDNQIFSLASLNGYRGIVEYLVNNHLADYNHTNFTGDSALHQNCAIQRMDMINYILSLDDVDVDVPNSYGFTPLLIACKKNNIEVARTLLNYKNGSAKINVNAKTNECEFPLLYATEYRNVEMIKLLLDRNADVYNERDNGHFICFTPFLIACSQLGNPDIIKLYLEHGVDVNRPNSIGMYPLEVACKSQRIKHVQLLLEHGANPRIKSKRITPLAQVCMDGKFEIAKLLIDYGVDVNGLTSEGLHPLLFLINELNPNNRFIKFLIEKGADLYCKDINGATLLYTLKNANKIDKEEVYETLVSAYKERNDYHSYADIVAFIKTYDTYKKVMNQIEYNYRTFEDKLFTSAEYLYNNNINNNNNNNNIDIDINVIGIDNINFNNIIYSNDRTTQNRVTSLVNQIRNQINTNRLIDRDNTYLYTILSDFINGFINNPELNNDIHAIIDNDNIILANNNNNNNNANHNKINNFSFGGFRNHNINNIPLINSPIASTSSNSNNLKYNPIESLHFTKEELNRTFLQACIFGKFHEMNYLLKNYPSIDVDIRETNGDTPLIIACRTGRSNIVKILLEHNANPNLISECGISPLYAATFTYSKHRDIHLIRTLLECGANPNIKCKFGLTPLKIACRDQDEGLVQLLLRYKADPNLKDNEGDSPLLTSCRQGSYPLVKILLSIKATNVNICDKEGNTPIMLACRLSYANIVIALLDANAKISLKNRYGQTCLHLCHNHFFNEIFEVFYTYHEKIDLLEEDFEGMSPYLLAKYDGATKAFNNMVKYEINYLKKSLYLYKNFSKDKGELTEEQKDYLGEENIKKYFDFDNYTDPSQSDRIQKEKNEKIKILQERLSYMDIEKSDLEAYEILLKDFYGNNEKIEDLDYISLREFKSAFILGCIHLEILFVKSLIKYIMNPKMNSSIVKRANPHESQNMDMDIDIDIDNNNNDGNDNDNSNGKKEGGNETNKDFKFNDQYQNSITEDSMNVMTEENICNDNTITENSNPPSKQFNNYNSYSNTGEKTKEYYGIWNKEVFSLKSFLNHQDQDGNTGLHYLCSNGKKLRDTLFTLFKYLTSFPELDKNIRNKNGYTPLHLGCYKNNETIVKKLLAHPEVEINCMNKFQQTPLMFGCKNRGTVIVRELLNRHPWVDVQDNIYGDTALTIITRYFQTYEILDLLLKKGHANVNCANKNGETPLLLACRKNNNNNISLLIDYAADVNVWTETLEGSTPLMEVIKNFNYFGANYLLKHNADPNICDLRGETALIKACKLYNKYGAEILIEHRADTNYVSRDGETARSIIKKNNFNFIKGL